MAHEITHDEPIELYHQRDDLSTSKLKTFESKGPRFYHDRYINKSIPVNDSKAAFVFGQAFEDLLTFGELPERYAVQPADMKLNTKAGKAWKTEQEGKAILKGDEFASMTRMLESVRENESAMALLDQARVQVSLRTDVDGLPGLQTRPDWMSDDVAPEAGFRPYIVDLKTTVDLGRMLRGSDIVKYRYHGQAAIARQVCRSHGVDPAFFLLVAEKPAPHRAVLMELTAGFIDAGDRWVREQTAGIRDCYARNVWPRFDAEVVTVDKPGWLVVEDEEETVLEAAE